MPPDAGAASVLGFRCARPCFLAHRSLRVGPTPAAGKTYANCFLRTALPPSKRCAKSYDQLRLNVSMEDCQTLISHDDFSISQFFPEGAATITQLRRWGQAGRGRPHAWQRLARGSRSCCSAVRRRHAG